MPAYTDPQQEAAWQQYLQPQLQQWTQAAHAGGYNPNASSNIASNTAFAQSQFNQKYAADQARAKAAADKQSATDAANGNMQQAFGLAGGDLSRVSSNPTDNLIRDQLSQKLTGQVLDPSAKPYDATTINAMMVGQGQTAAAAESARNQQMMDSIASNGGSAFDPGVRAALQQSLTQRQNQVSDSQLNINQQANLANFQAEQNARLQNNQAQMQAASSLQNQNNAQQQRQTGASQNYQQLLGQQRFSTTGGATAAPQATSFSAAPAAPAAPVQQPTSFQAYQDAMARKPVTSPSRAYAPITR